MMSQRFMSLAAVAIGSLLVGGVCGYKLSPTQAASSKAGQSQPVVLATVAPASTVAAQAPPRAPNPVKAAAITAAPASNTAAPASIASAPASVASAPASIAVPMAPGSRVAAVESFRCDVPNGSPVIVVQAMDEEGVWYVQDASERVEGSSFVCKAVFGNDATPAGTEFQIAAIVVTNSVDAQRFVPGAVLTELPTDLPVTTAVGVVRQ